MMLIGLSLTFMAFSAGSPSPSFSVAESSHIGPADMARSRSNPVGPVPVPWMLARTGEQFRFRISLSLQLSSTTPLEVRLSNADSDHDKKLPRFLRVDLAAAASAGAEKRVVEFSGVPGKGDIGDLSIGVYERGGNACVGRVVIEVVETARK